jgi:phenylacetate-CoA ligase
MWWAYGWRGIRIGDRVARFWGVPVTAQRRLLARAADLATNRVRFSAFAFTDADLERYWKRCLAFRPVYFHGYVSMLEAFAQYVRAEGYDGTRLGLTSIVATSEVLTSPQRQLLEATFGCPVQVEYGCGEVGPIAYECERGSLHVMAQDLVVEVLRPDGADVGPGEAGEVVVTDLNNRAMPLVRYQLGDFASVGDSCPCGRALPVLKAICGRAYDFVLAPDGRRYHGEYFMYLIEDLRRSGIEIRAFQVLQTSANKLKVAVVPPADSIGAEERAVEALLGERLPGMEVHAERTAVIPRLPSGKMQVVVNRLEDRNPAADRAQVGDSLRPLQPSS